MVLTMKNGEEFPWWFVSEHRRVIFWVISRVVSPLHKAEGVRYPSFPSIILYIIITPYIPLYNPNQPFGTGHQLIAEAQRLSSSSRLLLRSSPADVLFSSKTATVKGKVAKKGMESWWRWNMFKLNLMCMFYISYNLHRIVNMHNEHRSNKQPLKGLWGLQCQRWTSIYCITFIKISSATYFWK